MQVIYKIEVKEFYDNKDTTPSYHTLKKNKLLCLAPNTSALPVAVTTNLIVYM